MRIIYLGAEVPSNRKLLESTSVREVGFSFWRIRERGLPTTKPYLLENYFSEDFSINVYPGIPEGANLSDEDLHTFAAEYESFIANNIDRLTIFNEVSEINPAFVMEQRRTVWREVPPGKFQPVWDPKSGLEGLNLLVEHYLDIGIPGYSIEDNTQLATVTRTHSRVHGTRFHAIGTAKPDNLRQVKLETASTLAWLSPMMRGETIIWNGRELVRYPKRMKEQARLRHQNLYPKAGVDTDKILEDDDKEVCRLAVWSYQQYERKVNGMTSEESFLYDNRGELDTPTNAETTPSVSDNKPSTVRKLLPRNPEELGNLPVFGYNLTSIVEPDGTIRDVTTVSSQSVSLRACDTCFVASNCPAFKPQSVCAFNLPVKVETKDQLKALINAVIEMQGQRVAFMRFAEEMSGGYADPNVSQEIDRLFKLIKTTKELDDSREFIRMTVERQTSGGILSTIFGDKAEVLKELPNGGLSEEQTTEIIRQSIEDK